MKKEKKRGSYSRLVKFFLQDKKKSISMLVLLISSSVFASIGPQILGNLADIISNGIAGDGIVWKAFWQSAALLLAIYGVQFVTKWVAGWISVRVTSNIAYKLRRDVEEKLWKLPLKYYDSVKHGDIMSIVTNDVDNIVNTLNQTGGDLLYYVLMLLGMLIMMFSLSWQLALVTMIIVPVSGFIVKKISHFSKPQFIKQWRYTGEINASVDESFNGHTVIKAFGQEEEFKEIFHEKNEKLYKASFYAMVMSGLIQPTSRFLTNINYVIVALVGALNMINGTMTVGNVLAFIQYARQFQQPFSQLAQMFSTLQSGVASVDRVYNLLEQAEEKESDGIIKGDYDFKGSIEFRDVSFSYTPDRKLIEHMNLRVEPGQMVAIVGGTGAGKTTLVNLIERFYEIDGGSIILDGQMPLNKLSREALRKNIGMVLQDTWLYQGTIRDNICYSMPEDRKVTEEEFMEACKATFVDDFVCSLPDGYDTIITNELTSISAGEKQLLTIARAFLRRPNLLILDEATSSVDTRTEALIQKALNRLREGRTSFVIAHRLSTIRNADIILVMDHGHIVEQGNHDTLLAKNGEYAKLYRAQFQG